MCPHQKQVQSSSNHLKVNCVHFECTPSPRRVTRQIWSGGQVPYVTGYGKAQASHFTFKAYKSSGLLYLLQVSILQLTGINRSGLMRVRPPCRALDAPAPSLHVLHVRRVQRCITLIILPVKLCLVDDDGVAFLDAACAQRGVDARCLQHLVMRAGQGRHIGQAQNDGKLKQAMRFPHSMRQQARIA